MGPPSPRRDSYSSRDRERDPPRRQRSRSRSPRRERDSRESRDSNRRRDDRDRPRSRDRKDSFRGNGGDRDRRRSPPASTSAAVVPAGDGGWGSRRPPNSPGRPSLGLPSQSSLANPDGEEGPGAVAVVKPIEPNFAPSGALAAETNTFQGVVLKYNEPPEARKPVRSWRLYVFKGKDQVEMYHVNKQSAYLFGRDRIVADIPVDHPSTSKQHAVLQFRQVIERSEFGDTKTLTKPFLIDLDSANGTSVNDEMVPASRYYELKTNDSTLDFACKKPPIIKFAFSTREYVLLAET
ncbi:smad nuclear-interacting protein 1, partial [Phenoliferia sp. Uapishka_3]